MLVMYWPVHLGIASQYVVLSLPFSGDGALHPLDQIHVYASLRSKNVLLHRCILGQLQEVFANRLVRETDEYFLRIKDN